MVATFEVCQRKGRIVTPAKTMIIELTKAELEEIIDAFTYRGVGSRESQVAWIIWEILKRQGVKLEIT